MHLGINFRYIKYRNISGVYDNGRKKEAFNEFL